MEPAAASNSLTGTGEGRGSGYGSRRKARIIRQAVRSHAHFMTRTCKPKITKQTHFGSTIRPEAQRIGIQPVGLK